jgi:hypothetical protein
MQEHWSLFMPHTKVVFYVPFATAEALAKRKERWLVPTAAFVRDCVEQALLREADADARGLFSDSPTGVGKGTGIIPRVLLSGIAKQGEQV